MKQLSEVEQEINKDGFAYVELIENDIITSDSLEEDYNPCDFDECNLTACHFVKDSCLGIPIQMNLCHPHYLEWEEMSIE